MFFRKAASKPAPFSPGRESVSLKDTPLWVELVQLLWFSLALFLLIALVSYSPQDPSWSTWTTKREFTNLLGRTGSVVSDLLLQLLGLTAFALVITLASSAHQWRNQEKLTLGKNWRYGAAILFLLSLSTVFQSVLPHHWTPWRLSNPGGMLGRWSLSGLEYLSGPVGALLVSIVLSIASAIVVFRMTLISQGIALTKKALSYLRYQAPQKLWDSFKMAFVRLKERAAKRREEAKQKEEILKIPEPMPEKIVPPPAPAPMQQLPLALEDQTGPSIVQETAPEDEEIFTLASSYIPGETPIGVAAPRPKIPRRRSSGPFQLPSLSMLSGKAESKAKPIDKNWYLEKAAILVQKLKDFGVEGEVVHISPGPVITVYEFKPASGVKIKEIANLSDDLTLALSVLSVRIVAPIPGKPVVGIEIPSPHREMVFFKDLIQETPFFNDDIRIPIALGRLASGEPVTADLAAMPHLLVAGSTGTGKSVFINTLIGSLLFRFNPDQLKLILVDPKMVELSLYEGIPHLLLPVVVDSKKAAQALRWTVDEMERRYTLMHQAGVRHIDAYNKKLPELLKSGAAEPESKNIPYIVVVIDEYADLMAVVPKDVELSIARLAQKARASGIHLVLATQRPSTDVVTGTIKANFPSRISFRVASSVDSKTILDRTGADRLLGHGDMLFHSAGFATLKRMQGSFISDPDIAKVVEYLKSLGEPEYDERILTMMEETANYDTSGGGSFGESDEQGAQLYDAAVRLVTEKGEASISLIQRHLRIGYNRAASLMEQLEQEGVVSQATGNSKRRTVIAQSI